MASKSEKSWQLEEPIGAVVFDCDGTLSQIEGIDYLAEVNGVGAEVKSLTETAMSLTGVNEDLYQKRLNLVRPTQQQIFDLGDHYVANLTPDVDKVIAAFQALNKVIYVVSAGIQFAVAKFVNNLGIPASHVYAVDVYFNEQGDYVDYQRESPLTDRCGKSKIIRELLKKHPRIVHIGDGMNDIEAAHLSTRFIGYGGAYHYERVAERCDFYIKIPSLASLLPLCLTLNEYECLSETARAIYHRGADQINQGNILIK